MILSIILTAAGVLVVALAFCAGYLVRGLLRRVDSDYLIDQIDQLESKVAGLNDALEFNRSEVARQAERAEFYYSIVAGRPGPGAQSKPF